MTTHEDPHDTDRGRQDGVVSAADHGHDELGYGHVHKSDHAHDHAHGHGSGGHSHDHGEQGHSHPTGFKGFLYGIFVPHSHDAADSIDDAMEASSAGIRALKISLALMLATTVLQGVVVAFSGSIALLADTIHNSPTR